MRAEPQEQRTEIPRHRTWGGPLVLPPNHKAVPGDKECTKCGRSWKGRCPCTYYKRCTTYIDILQSEFALKKYDRRMVAYGMSQRPDLVVGAAACREPDVEKGTLQEIADAAKEHAMASASATIGTALHSLTEQMDKGLDLGYVPEPYPADLRAYEEATRAIEWVGIESFRVNDEYKVAGTTDRLGWYKGRLRIFDLKTSPKENPLSYPHGPAMQLAMYARSTPYDIPTDMRVKDPAEVDLGVAYIISLPAGKGRCQIRPIDIMKGWGACKLAAQVWEWRETKNLILDDDLVRVGSTFADMAARAGTILELKMLWKRAAEQGQLKPDLKVLLTERAETLKAQDNGGYPKGYPA